MKIRSEIAVILSIGIVMFGIVLSSVTGLWSTKSTKTPRKLDVGSSTSQVSTDSTPESSGSGSGDSADSTDSAVASLDLPEYDPADIKGSYTFVEISGLYNIPIQELAAAFALDENEIKTLKCKDLGTIFADAPNEIGTASMRLFVSFYYGLDYASAEEVFLPKTAVDVLKQRARMTPDQILYLEIHTVEIANR